MRQSVLLMFLVAIPTVAASDFRRGVYPILQRACFECHGSAKQEGGLRLDDRVAFYDSGTVVAGHVDDSELIRRILLPKGHAEAMPAIGEPLPPAEVDLLTKWVEAGAEWPDDFVAPEHWSYVVPVRPDVPETNHWGRNEVDAFVLRKLQQQGMQPSGEATPETLVRRLSFDLTGLPPTVEQVTEFANHPSEAAWEKLVDRMLASPQFGERWARPWLDMARYADSHGFQKDNFRDIWAYRDWVIQAMNADMPFDQFTVEQIAGDLLPNATQSQIIATGFHRCTPTNVEAGSLPEETRIEAVMDRVNTTGAVWLGTTMECCQCHDHKYDPLSIENYYGMLAFFNSTQLEADRADPKKPSSIAFQGPSMELTNAANDRKRERLKAELQAIDLKLTDRRAVLADDLDQWFELSLKESLVEPTVQTLTPVSVRSLGPDDSHTILEDGSVLFTGTAPQQDTVTFTFTSDTANITALRLDALTDPTLPGTGPGRGDKVRNNFVLNEFVAHVIRTDGSKQRLRFERAFADFSQKNYQVGGALSRKARTGWAINPEFSKPHWAVFVLKTPLTLSEGEQLEIQLVQNFGQARTIGRPRLSEMTGVPEQDAIPAEIAALQSTPAVSFNPKQRKMVLDYRLSKDAETMALKAKFKKAEADLKAIKNDTTLIMVELQEPRPTFVFERGDYRSPGQPVKPHTPEVLHSMPSGPANRLTLARWLVSTDNPLVARVTVNRWWAEIFGRGLVATTDDFGIKGDRPTHPDLLDWLSVEFMQSGWSMKSTLKTIVMSAAYRQKSEINDAYEMDPENQWLSRGPRFRMDAEMIRDNLLAVSGLLSDRQFGPPIRPFQPAGIWSKVGGTNYKYEVSKGEDQHRRGIYVVIKRGAPYPSFMNFDASPRFTCTVRRGRTNTPSQALTLLNDPVYVEAAQNLADQIVNHQNLKDVAARIEYAFQSATARKPTAREYAILLDTLETQTSIELSRNHNHAQARMKAWQNLAAAILNLHETITKN